MKGFLIRMAIIVCEQCKAEIDVPAGYNVPFIKCPECGTPQRVMQTPAGGPKFKILNSQRRFGAANNQPVEQPPMEAAVAEQSAVKPSVKPQTAATPRIEHNPTFKPIEEEKLIIDSVGEEGIKKALDLVSEYICLTSPKAKAAGRAKAIQKMMKEKYPASMATKAIAYAERLPEAMAMGKSKNIKKIVIIAGVAAFLIAGVLSFL